MTFTAFNPDICEYCMGEIETGDVIGYYEEGSPMHADCLDDAIEEEW